MLAVTNCMNNFRNHADARISVSLLVLRNLRVDWNTKLHYDLRILESEIVQLR